MAELAADFADGIPGKAIAYAQSGEFIERKEEVLKTLRRLDSMAAEDLYKRVREWAGRKQEIPDILALIHLWLRDVLVVKSTRGSGRIVFREEERELFRQADGFSYPGLEKCMQALETLQERINANVNLEVSLEIFMHTIREALKEE